jgi:2'-5' RNA ligase
MADVMIAPNKEKTAEAREGLMIALRVPHRIKRALMEYPLTSEEENNLHITLVFMGKAADFDVDSITAMVRGWAEKTPKMEGRLGGIGTFDNPGQKVLWAAVNIPGLAEAHTSLSKLFTDAGFEIAHSHGFTPHATLAYSEEPFTEFPALPEKAMQEFQVPSVWVVAGPTWAEVPLSNPSTKIAPPDAIPQENVTALTRGRGPRRGNLEDLLKYWRPIMKKPGGFRRCLVILADHPELYPLERICAWLHHETTGLWPNEGNHHGTGKGKDQKKRGKRTARRVVGAARRGKKDAIPSMLRLADGVRVTRATGQLLRQPISSQESVDFKAAMWLDQHQKVGLVTSRSRTGRVAQSAGSVLTPGDLGDVRHPVRSSIFEALTPGGGGGSGGRGLGIPGVGRRREGGARNKFRCPPGFENGGKFTNSSFTTCGRQILGIPKAGPGSLTAEADSRIRRIAEDSTLIRSIGDLRNNANPFDIVRAAQIPSAPKEVSTDKRQASVDLILSAFDEDPSLGDRAVRRDGIILEPFVGLEILTSVGEFDDLNDGVLVTADTTRQAPQVGAEEVPTLVSGLRAVVFHVPGHGTFSVRRVGGDMTDEERAGMLRTFSTALRSVDADVDDPTQAIRKFTDNSNGRYVIDQNIDDDGGGDSDAVKRELVSVERGGRKITVPLWVFQTYLSRTAPRRNENDDFYVLVKEDSDKSAGTRYLLAPVPATKEYVDADSYYAQIETGAAFFTSLKVGRKRNRKPTIGGTSGSVGSRLSGSGRVFMDSGVNRHRCSPGTRWPGRFSDAVGRNCGVASPKPMIAKLMGLAGFLGIDLTDAKSRIKPDTPQDKKLKAKLKTSTGVDYDASVKDVTGFSTWLNKVADIMDPAGSDTLGPTIGGDTRANAPKDPVPEMPKRAVTAPVRKPGQTFDDDGNFIPIGSNLPPGILPGSQAGGPLSADEISELLQSERDKGILGNEMSQRLETLDAVTDDPIFTNEATNGAKRKLFDAVEKASSAEAGRVAMTNDKGPVASKINGLLNKLADKISGEQGGTVAPNANGIDTPDAPKKPGILKLGAGKLAELINPDRKRRDKVVVPEVANLTPEQKHELTLSMIEQWGLLDSYFKVRMVEAGIITGTDEPFGDKHLAQYLNVVQANDPGSHSMITDWANDWTELFSFQGADLPEGDVTLEMSNAVDGPAFEDRLGRLSPFHRDSIMEEAGILSIDFGAVDTSELPDPTPGPSVDGKTYVGMKMSEFLPLFKDLEDRELDILYNDVQAKLDANWHEADPDFNHYQKQMKALKAVVYRREEDKKDALNKKLESDGDLPVNNGNLAVPDAEDIINDTSINDTDSSFYLTADGDLSDAGKNVLEQASEPGMDFSQDEFVVNALNTMHIPGNADVATVEFAHIWDGFDINDPKSRVGVILLDRKTGKQVIRKPSGNFGGYNWTYSKGGIDQGESVVDAALREAQEETGITSGDMKILDALPKGYEGTGGSKNYFLIAAVDLPYGVSPFKTDSETDEIKLVSLGQETTEHLMQTTSPEGQKRDLEIHAATQNWVDQTKWGSDGYFSDQMLGVISGSEPVVKGSPGLNSQEQTTGPAPTSFTPDTVKVGKADALGLQLKHQHRIVNDTGPAQAKIQAALDSGQTHRELLEDPSNHLTGFPPSQELFDALLDYRTNPGRYKDMATGDEGINGQVGYPTYMIRDTGTGEMFVLKRPARNDNEHLSELGAAIVTDELGIPQVLPTFQGDTYTVKGDATSTSGESVTKFGDTTNRAMVIEPTANLLLGEGGSTGVYNTKQMGIMLAQQYLISEPDNHGANRVSIVDPSGKTSVFAFDAGKAFIPHDPKFGEQKFGGRFAQELGSMNPRERAAVLKSAQATLRNMDVDAAALRIANMGSERNLTQEERARLDDMADFVRDRHDGWEAAFAVTFPDDVFDPSDKSLPSASPVITPVEIPSHGQTVRRDADPTSKKSYEKGVGVLAADMNLSPEDVEAIQNRSAEVIRSTMERNDSTSTTIVQDVIWFDGPDVAGSKATVADGVKINVGGGGSASEVEMVEAGEIRVQLSDHTHEQVKALLEAHPERIYKVKADVSSHQPGWSTVPTTDTSGTGTSQNALFFGIEDGAEIGIKSESQFHGTKLSAVMGEGGKGPTFTAGDVSTDEMIVADFGDIKILLMPDVFINAGGGNVANPHKTMRVFFTGDEREDLRAFPQETMESVFGSLGIDARPPTEPQIRDRLARMFIRNNSRPALGADPAGGYGVPYGSSSKVTNMLGRMNDFGEGEFDITVDDFVVGTSNGYPTLRLSDEKAALVAAKIGRGKHGVGDGSPLRAPFFGHRFSSGSRFTAPSNEANAEKFVDSFYVDGTFTGGADRLYVDPKAVGTGQSLQEDTGTGSADAAYLTVSRNGSELDNGHWIMFSDLAVGRQDITYTKGDVYGHLDTTGRRHWGSGGTDPWTELSDNAILNDSMVKGTSAFNEGVLLMDGQPGNAGTVPPSLNRIAIEASKRSLTIEQMNDKHIAISAGGGDYKMVYWKINPATGNPVPHLGPVVTKHELTTARMSGKLAEYKTASLPKVTQAPA